MRDMFLKIELLPLQGVLSNTSDTQGVALGWKKYWAFSPYRTVYDNTNVR